MDFENPETGSPASKIVRNPLPVSQIDITFGGDMDALLPPWEEIPEEFKRDRHPFNKVVSKWFFGRLPPETDFRPKPGVDANAALRHVVAILRSFQPKHEHKEAGCAYLLSLWFTDICIPNAQGEAQPPAK